ncbi:monocarboxylate transporter 10-like [Bombus pyrosoma]|uniref:monocarboxylate transporter 10-like n=1 Tax=Bombus pyrosoma TaxID=396416 RepID=UPI001CB8CABB|nr:monocarboxylate transporter 10-like [Bombus pyrosoma]XP_043578468.1 monocarboxylate transporter 10-like [Bombus pyrosoma]XP_043578469.1 monocarboxylate transporter 10-like [Bombus pyrosoma]XP_043578470.1 monocarboxylate transporter 10-like [Bombus pyrosoma]XP_043578471.1 monocarboxylate transporter 10-like [Bombus pyrosoma]XP_043578472.1 monocarboxylate transporter 10-like [Bombus pyrosoma]XP_043578473.1 monocarboxylate transporter 10-like [Bombus pyrosoma]XP_043578474.1 monocarboxylate t
MLVDDCGSAMGWTSASVRGGWSTPGGCRNSAMNFGGSVPSLHPAGSIRSLRSQHSMQGVPETPRRCMHCHPVHVPSTPNNYVHHPMQYYTPSHCPEPRNGIYTPHRGSSYHGDTRMRYMDAEGSLHDGMIGNSNWVLGDLRSLHRCVPAFRRPGIDVAAMRTHFYPEGGWGWLVCAAGFLALLLTTGMQLAFGLLHVHAVRRFGEEHLMDLAWVGALSTAVSRGSAPLVVGACRRGSTRLTAVIGGIVLALASLFTSFAAELHQVLLSYGVVLGTGAGLVRETAGLVLGHYFRKRREFVEMVVQAGTGVGIVLFSVIYREAVGKLGWEHGMQLVTGVLSLAFFLGLIYRSASLYHPQRRAMLHVKNQRGGKLKEKKTASKPPRQPWVDLSPLGSRPVRMLMLAAGAAGFGLYTPAFYIAIQGHKDGLEASAVMLLQTCLGLAAALGCAAWGVVTAKPSAQCLVSRQYLCQAALLGVAIAQMALGSVQGYHGLVLASGLYGASLGGALYSLKMLALERLRAKHFARSWALVQAAEALPILLGVPLTGYMNANSSRVGYYACTLSSLCGAALLFLVGWGRQPASPLLPGSHLSNVTIPPPCACPPPPRPRLPKSQSLHVPLDMEENLRDREMERMHTAEHYYQPQFYGPLRPSKSVPEGLSHQDSYRSRPRRHRDVTVIEQITTSV